MRRAGRLVATLAALAAPLLFACAESGEERPMDELRVAFTRRLTMAPLFIAEAEGFFEAQGLDVELVAVESAAVGMPALLQGRIDVLPGPVSSAFFNAVARGGRLRIVADKGRYRAEDCAHNAFVVSAAALEASDPPVIRRFSTAREHFLQFLVEKALTADGYDPDEIELFHVPQAAEYDALLAGRLDGAWVGEPWLTRIRLAGGAEIVSPTNTRFDGYQYSVLAFGPSLLDDRPDVGERFMVAFLQGLRAYNEGKTDGNMAALMELMRYERSELEEVCWPSMGTDGQVGLPGLLEFQEWAFERGELDAVMPTEDFWEPRFVEHAARVLNGG
jgi:NitT/TauT family transport system substrate-binding protein